MQGSLLILELGMVVLVSNVYLAKRRGQISVDTKDILFQVIILFRVITIAYIPRYNLFL